jgi:uncharacterized membrane protein YfhO
MVENADVEMDSMTHIMPKQKAFIDKRFADQLKDITVEADSLASIKFVSYKPNHLVYESNTAAPQVAVFSEIYYDKGWNAYVDGQLTPHFRCDYVLRGMVVPAGKHTIDFKFEPSVVATGEKVSLVSSILLYGGMLIIGGLGLVKRKKEDE